MNYKEFAEKHQEVFKAIENLLKSAAKIHATDVTENYKKWLDDQLKDLFGQLKIQSDENKNLRERTTYFKTLYEKGLDLSSERDIPKLLQTALDAVIQITHAERGFIAVLGENHLYDFQAARAIDEKEINDPHSQISQSILKNVINFGEQISSGRIQGDPRFAQKSSVLRLNLQSVICLPLQINSKVFGALYVDNSQSQNAFDMKSLGILQSFASQISRAVEAALHVRNLEKEHSLMIQAAARKIRFQQIIGSSTSMQKIMLQTLQVAPTDATVLLLGESGTGKELIARAIHENSNRVDHNFIAINCSAIPSNLLESELFGHEKGAFTGATAKKIGKFEAADKGTLFLDEIADMPMELQVKMLRILQTMELQPLGSNQTRKIDVRIIAATNKPLKEKVALGQFRDDLFYRLNVFAIEMPPLRNRKEDVPSLAYYFLKKYGKRHNKENINRISAEAIQILSDYSWPGNVRELENVIERAVILCHEDYLNNSCLPPEITSIFEEEFSGIDGREIGFDEKVNAFKKRLIVKVMEEKKNNMTDVAKALGLNRTYLYRLIAKLGISTSNDPGK